MSALPPEADMLSVGINVCYVPIADISDKERCRRQARYTVRFTRTRFSSCDNDNV